MRIFTHRIPFSADEVAVVTTLAHIVLQDAELREEFRDKFSASSLMAPQFFDSFCHRLSVFVEMADAREKSKAKECPPQNSRPRYNALSEQTSFKTKQARH